MKPIIWNDAKTQKEIFKRYSNASQARQPIEERWMRTERVIYSTSGIQNFDTLNNALDYSNMGPVGVDSSNADVNVAYTFKNLRFIHAQMSANPPSVVMRPNSSDQDDRRKADAADRVVRWAIRKYEMQELTDRLSLNCLLYGTGFAKILWDSEKGGILDFDPETQEMRMEGDISVIIPFVWNVRLDPDAKCWEEVKWITEDLYLDYDEACAMYPGKEDLLKTALITNDAGKLNESRSTELGNERYNSVKLIEYWEKGLPTNGYLGRYCITTPTGEVVVPCRPNPCRFKAAGAVSKIESSDLPDEVKEQRIARLPEMAFLPYHMLSDIDVPNSPWGRSAVEYAAGLQENLNRLDSHTLDAIQAASSVKLVVPETAEINDNFTNSNWDIIKLSGNQGPYWQNPAQLMPELASSRANYVNGINDTMGVNEAMFGQQSREQSGASMQYATNQGNMIRRRLFNKYVMVVESMYKAILNLARKHWTIERSICVLGKENALEAIDLKGADIDGGYDVVGEYGVSLSLDPMTRREEILTLQPLFKEAGVPVRNVLRMLKLNELDGMFDEIALADNRQKEIFDEIASTGNYIAPEKFMDHENMIAYALKWFMTSEFKYLDPNIQLLCKQHIQDRIQLAAEEKGPVSPAEAVPGQPPGPMPSAPAEGVPPPTGLPPITNG